MALTEAKAPTNPAANQGRQIDQGIDSAIQTFVDAGRTAQTLAKDAQSAVQRVAADEPLASLLFAVGTGFLAGAIWKTLR